MDPYESEFSNRMAMYWAIFWVYIVAPIAFVTLIVLSVLGVL
jgi:hypothetical protein